MTFETLLANQQNKWRAVSLKYDIEKDLVYIDDNWPDNSLVGWTYIYVVGNEVKYIGNTKGSLKKRIKAELNQKIDKIRTVDGAKKLGYTNIRVSQQLRERFEKHDLITLRFLNKLDYTSANINGNQGISVIEDNYSFDDSFLLRWSPRSIQGHEKAKERPIPIERFLILKHIFKTEGHQTPEWNLGLG